LVIYREYIQNSVDAINSATSSGLLEDSRAGDVQVSIDKPHRKIIIEDNGTGIPAEKA
jgi:HSP90 family molecular chaperone